MTHYGTRHLQTHTEPDSQEDLLNVFKVARMQPKLSKHCFATAVVKDTNVLIDATSFIVELQKVLAKEKVQCLGYVSHEFGNKSFTVVVGLAESHISVHTWPERNAVQLDVFLCNYMRDNTKRCERIFDALVSYFDPIEVDKSVVERL